MIANINNDTKEVKLCSVFRDSYLDTGDGSFKKCNAAYAKVVEAAINMLNKNLDLSITDYVTVDFNAVVECVDLLGGITLDEVTDEEAVLMQGYMDEINKLTKNNSKYLSGGGTNVTLMAYRHAHMHESVIPKAMIISVQSVRERFLRQWLQRLRNQTSLRLIS